MEKLVSIIIPCYNQANYLPESIESALSQTYPNVEVIVVDDGSPDDTYEVAKKFPVKIIRKTNGGLSSARNAGIMNSSGSYILPLDADDKIHKDFLKKTVHLAESDEKIGVVIVGMEYIGEIEKGKKIPPLGKTLTMDRLLQWNGVVVTSLVRRKAMLECGGYNPMLIHGYEDWCLWIDIFKRGWKFVDVEDTLFYYRLRKGTMISESSGAWDMWNRMKIRKIHHELYKNKPIDWC